MLLSCSFSQNLHLSKYPNPSSPVILCHVVSCCFMLFQRQLVSVDHWPADSLSPLGHYVRVLGKDGDKDVETQVRNSLIEELIELLAQ